MSENSELVTTGTQAKEMARQLPVATPAVDIYENEAALRSVRCTLYPSGTSRLRVPLISR